ncbi:uncharacterized protein LOC128236161 [Mya arenaria]|uniref:uncharacterized protein LOC128236161 n=1 Tax=Mya arenaria TaxID=6604 RepID=UPI0022E52522|nr:uncharacterized protein LOC128236161 [Mya arenaria]
MYIFGLFIGGPPLPCGAGYYMPYNMTDAITESCVDCHIIVEDNWYLIDCLPCPAGEYCQGTGLVNPSGVCSPGFFCPEGSSQPSPCAPGTYAPEQNHTTCITCPVGFYCKEQASVTAVPCPWNIYCKLGSSAPVCDLLPHGSEGTNVSISSSKDKGHPYTTRTTVTTLKAVCVDCHLPVVSYTWNVRQCLQSLSMEECRNCDFHVLQHSSNLDTFTLDVRAENIAHWDYFAVYVTVTFNDGSQSRAYQTWKSITVANDTYCHTVPYSGLTVAEQFDILCDKLPVLDPVIVQYKLSILTDGIEVMANVGSSCNMTDLVLMSGKPEEDFILQLHYAVTYYGDIVWDTRFQAQVTEPPVLTEEMVQEMDNVTSQVSFNDSDSLYNSLLKITGCVHIINLDEAPDPSGQPKHTIQTAEVRSHVINKLSEIDAQDAQLVNALSFTLSTVVKKPDQITSEAKTQSVSIYSKLVKAYKNSSAEVSQTDLAGTASLLVSGFGSLVFNTVNETKEQSEENEGSTKTLLSLVTDVMDVIQTDQEVDGPPITIVTPSIYLSMNKMKPGNLTRISMEPVKTNGSKISLTIPDDLDLTGNNDSISMQYMYTKKNPYSWKESVAIVTSGVQSLTLKDSHNKPVHMNNLKSPLKLAFDFDDVATSAKIPFKLIIQKQGKTFDQIVRHARPGTATFNITLTRGNTRTFVLDLPQNLSSIKLGISEEGGVDIEELLATGFRYPGDIELINAVYGRGNGDGGNVLDNITRYCQECDHRCCKDNTASCIGIYAGCGMFCSHLPDISMTANCTDLNEDLTAKDTPGNVISGKTIYLSAREPKLEESNVTSYVLYFTVSVDLTDTQTREELMLREQGCLGNETFSECYALMDLTTTLRSFHLGCYYWDVEKDDWTQEGMQISDQSLSSSTSIECLTSHLSSFGSSVLVAPTFVNPIDDIALFLTFFENPVVVTAVIMLWIVYFFLIHWAKRYDRRDVEQVGVIPCMDNKPEDQYVYLVCFVTSWWRSAGTSANVYFYMTGTDGVSGRKHVNTADRVCLQPGSEDWLVVTTEHSLGHISSITVWHDNTGSSPHWYLNQVHIKDVESGSSWNYIYNDWLAVDMGSLLSTTATIEATSEDQMRMKQKYRFMIQSSREIRDGHLWISIFSKPPASQFTRVQRLTCALSLLLSTMLTNLMFYGIPTDEPTDQVKAGPFSLSLTQIVIGIESSLIMFPVNLLMIQLFMKVKPRERKMRRKMKDPDETFIASFNASMTDRGSTRETVSAMTADFDFKNIQRQLDIDLFRSLYTDAIGDCSEVDPNLVTNLLIENLPDRFSWSVAGEALGMNVVLDNQGQFTLAPRGKDTGSKEDLALKPNRSDLSPADGFDTSALKFDSCGDIGHTTRSPTISMSGDASSNTASEMKRFSTENIFSEDRCVLDEAPVVVRAKKDPRFLPWWFLYVAWTFAISVCLVSSFFVMLYGLKFGYARSIEWLVSFITGILQSVFAQQPLKTLVMAVLLTMIFKKEVEFEDFGADMELDNDEEYLCTVNPKPDSHLPVVPPLPQRMMEAIKQRLKLEGLMDLTIRDMILHFIYLTVVILMLTGHRNITTCFQTTRAVRTVLVDAKYGMPLKEVNSIGGVYQYLEDTVIPVMKVASQHGSREISAASEFFLVGSYRLRQLRVGDSCTSKIIKGLMVGCKPSYSLTGEDSGDYNKSWSIPLLDEDYAINPWIHQSGWSLKTLPFVGSHATYSGGGYVVPLSGQEQRDTDSLEDLETRGWIDRNTRAVFLEFTFYNPNVDIFTVGVYLFEFTNTGGVYPSHHEISTSLHHYSSSYGMLVALCEGLFAAFNLTFIIIEVKKFRKQGKSEYFSSIWTIMDLCQIGMAVAVVVMFVQRVLAVGSVMGDFKSSKGETFVSFYPAVFWDVALMYMMGGLMTTVILKTIKLLRFNRKVFLLSYTLSAVHLHLLSLILIFTITTFAFAAFSYLLFNSVFRGYKTLGDAWVSNVGLLMGMADFVGLYEYNQILGVVFLLSFVITVYFGVMTFVQAILNVGRIEAKDRIKGKKNDLDLVNYITSKLKMFVQQK